MFLLRVCSALNASKLEYAVVGGYAVALHGAVRGTIDLDIVVKLSRETFVEVEGVFKSLGLVPRLPVTAEQVFHFRKEYMEQRDLVAWSFYDPKRPSHQLDVILTHNAATIRTTILRVHGISIKVASLTALIQMKKKSGRPQDFADVKALEALKNS